MAKQTDPENPSRTNSAAKINSGRTEYFMCPSDLHQAT